ncbi:MAG TPA: flagellar biosynthesis protein FlgF, partial [Holosporales bacterium]|nr:flagellar biosynthesis protein FlgF [Holosporales bacterium]
MPVSLDITLSMQKALQDKLNVLSNNAANAGTVGFQEDSVIFSQFLG